MTLAYTKIVNIHPMVGGTRASCPKCGAATPIPAEAQPMVAWIGKCSRGHKAKYRLAPDPEVPKEVQQTVDQLVAQYSKAELAQIARLISPTFAKGEMTPEEFEEFRAYVLAHQVGKRGRPITEEALDTAREVMVMGASASEVAQNQNKSRAAVSAMLTRIRAYRHLQTSRR